VRVPSELRSYSAEDLKCVCVDYQVSDDNDDPARLLGRLLPKFPAKVLTKEEFTMFTFDELSKFCQELGLRLAHDKESLIQILCDHFTSSSPSPAIPFQEHTPVVSSQNTDVEPSTAIPAFKVDNADEPNVLVHFAAIGGEVGTEPLPTAPEQREPTVELQGSVVQQTIINATPELSDQSMSSEDESVSGDDALSSEDSKSPPKKTRKRKTYLASRVFSRRVASPKSLSAKKRKPRKSGSTVTDSTTTTTTATTTTTTTATTTATATATTPTSPEERQSQIGKRKRDEFESPTSHEVDGNERKRLKLSTEKFFKSTLPLTINGVSYEALPVTEQNLQTLSYMGRGTQPMTIDGKSVKVQWELEAHVVEDNENEPQ